MDTHLIQTSSKTRLLRRRINQRIIQPPDHLIRHPLKSPRPQTHILRPQLHLGHIVHIDRPLWAGGGIVSRRVVLQLTEGFLDGDQGVDDETERGCLAVGFLATPPLAFVQTEVFHGVVGGSPVVEVGEFLESGSTCCFDQESNEKLSKNEGTSNAKFRFTSDEMKKEIKIAFNNISRHFIAS